MYFLYYMIIWLIWNSWGVVWIICVWLLGVDVRLCEVWLTCVGNVRIQVWSKTYFGKTMISDSLTVGSPLNLDYRFVIHVCTLWALGFLKKTLLDIFHSETSVLSAIPTRWDNLLGKISALSAISASREIVLSTKCHT